MAINADLCADLQTKGDALSWDLTVQGIATEYIEKLQVTEGDSILAIETADGIEIIASNEEFGLGMKAYHEVV